MPADQRLARVRILANREARVLALEPIECLLERRLTGGGLGLDGLEDDWLRDLAANHSNFEYVPVLSECENDSWPGERGFVHDAVLRTIEDFSDYEVYACGPPVMIEAARDAFVARGLEAERLYFDSFEYAVDE